MDIQYQQVEAFLLNVTYWHLDLYNTADGKDNWNLEDFSLLGPNRSPRNVDIIARPYPMRSSARPSLLFFDLASRHGVIMLQGPSVSEPTVIYMPFGMHYSGGFEIRATSADIEWDRSNNLLYWRPDAQQTLNQLILSPQGLVNSDALPRPAQDLLPRTPLRMEWPRRFQRPVEVEPKTIVLGSPTKVVVHARDEQTLAPVAITARVDGKAVPTTDSTFTYTFQRRIVKRKGEPGEVDPVVTIIAPDYHEMALKITWLEEELPPPPPPPRRGKVLLRVEPAKMPLNRAVDVIVRAEDDLTHAPLAGTVKIDGRVAGNTNSPFRYTFRKRRVGRPPDVEFQEPQGTVSIPGYPDTILDFDWLP